MDEEVDDVEDDYEGEDVFNCIRQAPSTHLFVVKNASTIWKGTVIFHTFIKIGDTNCKVIVNSGSCINVVSPEVFESWIKGVTLFPSV